MQAITPEVRDDLLVLGPSDATEAYLFPLFAEHCLERYATEIGDYRQLVSSADLRTPHTWFPFARAMKRRIVYHHGPTNSGKTHTVLQRLMQAASGVYCGPLRLLAMEVFNRINQEGVFCNLHTGQELQVVPFAKHTACTVEMALLALPCEVAVIDEIQMLTDEFRGWAWTKALLGLQASEVHICGDPSALPLVRHICSLTGDDFEVHQYERFKPLQVCQPLNGNFSRVEKGDCIVAFSRQEIFDVKRAVEVATNHRCCVVYGGLPPETRKQQAGLFNAPDNGYNVLVASDAVGMGLNLNIRRVIFWSLHKFDGLSTNPIPPPQVKQIGGRAGRRGSLWPEGMTTTFFAHDLPYLMNCLSSKVEEASTAGLCPVFEQVEMFASKLPNISFAQLLDRFEETAKVDDCYFLVKLNHVKPMAMVLTKPELSSCFAAANALLTPAASCSIHVQRLAMHLDKVEGLSLQDRYTLCFSPVNVRDGMCMHALVMYAEALGHGQPVRLAVHDPSLAVHEDWELMDLELRHQVVSLYSWLSQQFPDKDFPDAERAEALGAEIAGCMGTRLAQRAAPAPQAVLRQQREVMMRIGKVLYPVIVKGALMGGGSATRTSDQLLLAT
eukprot:SM000138S00040  [mRNA]  locus=s138:164928:169646:- [translate_table: standard]